VNKWSIPDILDKYSPVRTSRRSSSRSPPAAAAASAAGSANVTPSVPAQATRYCNVCAGNLPESEFTAPKVPVILPNRDFHFDIPVIAVTVVYESTPLFSKICKASGTDSVLHI
jgi:hypothetical protein